MNQRQKKLLFSIVDQYIKKATPVASKLLAGRGGFKVSSATVRNEMADLEDEGYLIQPHTSAGRIPTEKGYEFYLERVASQSEKLAVREEKELRAAAREKEWPEKTLAKTLAELSGEAVILAFGPKDIYYTGLTNLFAKPEFQNQNLIYRIGEVVDHLDERIDSIFKEIEEEETYKIHGRENCKIKVLIGKKNPLGDGCSAIIAQYGKVKKKRLVIIFGPMRMDYRRNIALIKYAKDLFATL